MKILSPLKAIRKACLDCVGGSPSEVKACTGNKMADGAPPCYLWPFRLGRDPRRKRSSNCPPKGVNPFLPR